MVWFIAKKKGTESSKFLKISFMLPYSWEMMFVDNSLDCVVSQRPLFGTLIRLPRPLSLMIPYSRRMMIVLTRPLHSVVSDRNGLGIFVSLPPAVLMGFAHEANIALEACLDKFCFLVLCWYCFTHGSKAPWLCSTFYKANVTSRALSSHFVSWF